MPTMKKRQCKICGGIYNLDKRSFRRIRKYYRQVCRECEKEDKKWYRRMVKQGIPKTPAYQEGRTSPEILAEKYTALFEVLQVSGVNPAKINAAKADKIFIQVGIT
jgi:hypothetical protein